MADGSDRWSARGSNCEPWSRTSGYGKGGPATVRGIRNECLSLMVSADHHESERRPGIVCATSPLQRGRVRSRGWLFLVPCSMAVLVSEPPTASRRLVNGLLTAACCGRSLLAGAMRPTSRCHSERSAGVIPSERQRVEESRSSRPRALYRSACDSSTAALRASARNDTSLARDEGDPSLTLGMTTRWDNA
jgi:hypothetical protein